MKSILAARSVEINPLAIRNSWESAAVALATYVFLRVYAYFHRCEFLSGRALSPRRIKRLRQYGFRVEGREITIELPPREAIEYLATIDGVEPRLIEIALDMIARPDDCLIPWTAAEMCLCQPNSGKRKFNSYTGRSTKPQHERSKGPMAVCPTLYTDNPEKDDAGRYLNEGRYHHIAVYADLLCHVTNEDNCIHMEWRYSGVKFLRAIGIASPADMLSFDLETYWRDHMPFAYVDVERYGRLLNRDGNGPKSTPRYNVDRARGGAMYLLKSAHPRGYDRSLQQFAQRLERKFQRYVIVKLSLENVLNYIEVKWGKEELTHYSDRAASCAVDCAAEKSPKNSPPKRRSIPRLMLNDR